MSELPKTDASTVLIVDDSQANLRLAAKFLEAIGGYQPVLVSNPARVLWSAWVPTAIAQPRIGYISFKPVLFVRRAAASPIPRKAV